MTLALLKKELIIVLGPSFLSLSPPQNQGLG